MQHHKEEYWPGWDWNFENNHLGFIHRRVDADGEPTEEGMEMSNPAAVSVRSDAKQKMPNVPSTCVQFLVLLSFVQDTDRQTDNGFLWVSATLFFFTLLSSHPARNISFLPLDSSVPPALGCSNSSRHLVSSICLVFPPSHFGRKASLVNAQPGLQASQFLVLLRLQWPVYVPEWCAKGGGVVSKAAHDAERHDSGV